MIGNSNRVRCFDQLLGRSDHRTELSDNFSQTELRNQRLWMRCKHQFDFGVDFSTVQDQSAPNDAAATAATSDADGDGVMSAAHGALVPWQRTPAGDGSISERLAPVFRGRAGVADEGGDRPGG